MTLADVSAWRAVLCIAVMYAEGCQRRGGDDQWERLILYVDWSRTVSSRCGGLRRGPVGFAHRVWSPGGPKYLGSKVGFCWANGEWRPFTCVSFDRVLYILRELPTNNAFRAAIELSRDLMPSGMQSGSEVLYFTLGATWDFLVNFFIFLKNRRNAPVSL